MTSYFSIKHHLDYSNDVLLKNGLNFKWSKISSHLIPTHNNSQFLKITQIPYNILYLQPQPKPLGIPPNGLIYLIKHETFIEKILKFTLATLGILTLIVAILGVMLYRNLGDLPDESCLLYKNN